MTTLAAQVAISIENARLYQPCGARSANWSGHCDAREVQLGCCRQCSRKCPCEMAVRFMPAAPLARPLRFLDYGQDARNRAGDVSGKAAPQRCLRHWSAGLCARRGACARSRGDAGFAQRRDAERKLDSQYVSLLFALWNDDDRTLRVANSGAVQPVSAGRASRSPSRLKDSRSGSSPIDLRRNCRSNGTRRRHRFVSDGILDAENAKGEMYGDERLAAFCAQAATWLRSRSPHHPR